MNAKPDQESILEEETPATPEAAKPPAPSAEAEIAKYRDLALRSQAELDNFRKRVIREKEDAIRYANLSLLERLLPVVDNFELGLEAAKTATDANSIALGMSMVQKQLLDFLKDSGAEVIATEGAPFDPNLHEAVSHQAHATVPDGRIVQQLRKGYKLKDRLLRPATVVVSKGPGES
ncbi:MAG TPA: nucleotide exchange factor GrpE [Chthoniobacterales bacterium]